MLLNEGGLFVACDGALGKQRRRSGNCGGFRREMIGWGRAFEGPGAPRGFGGVGDRGGSAEWILTARIGQGRKERLSYLRDTTGVIIGPGGAVPIFFSRSATITSTDVAS